MKTIFTLLLFTSSLVLNAQTHISGTLKGNNGEIIAGANVVLANTYDGTTDSVGRFKFNTSETGKQLLRFTAVGYKTDSLWVI